MFAEVQIHRCQRNGGSKFALETYTTRLTDTENNIKNTGLPKGMDENMVEFGTLGDRGGKYNEDARDEERLVGMRGG